MLPTKLETIIVIIAIIGLLSWMSEDELNDQLKTAEVVASINPLPPAKDPQIEHKRHLAELDKQGRYMTSFDQIVAK